MEESTQAPADVEATSSVATDPEAQATTGSEAVTNTETEQKEVMIPLERFQEVNNSLRDLKSQLAELKPAEQPTPETEQLDPAAEKMLESWATKNGFVRQGDLAEDRRALAFERDMSDLARDHKGFAPEKVAEFARENLGTDSFLTSKAAYKLVFDKMTETDRIESARKAALADAAKPGAFAEKPGPGGAKAPAEESSKGKTLKERIALAREKISS